MSILLGSETHAMGRTFSILFSVAYLLINHVSGSLINITTDQSALLVWKSQISFSPNNVLERNWTAESSVCGWIGVICASRHHRVTALNVSAMSLIGRIPPHLGNLSFLRSLDISNNNFHGNLPEELAQLRRLSFINIDSNNFSGALPTFFSSLKYLRTMYLAQNEFSGSIPSSISNISRLKVLSFDQNFLEGSIPEGIGDLHYLTSLSLQRNRLTGPIPPSIFNLSSLQRLDLSSNNLTGRLPSDICYHLPNLKRLSISDTGLDGHIPPSLQKCSQLEVLSISVNRFSGSIPREIGNLTMLTVLHLGENSLEGPIPSEIGNLKRLQVFGVSSSGLSGSIPESIFNISTLQVLNLVDNRFSGNLPSNLGQGVPDLKEIYFGMNHLSGNILDSIANASKLTILDLSYNSFTGLIPNSLGNLGSLEILQLGSNNFVIDSSSSEIMFLTSLTNCQYLKELVIGDNSLNGILPSSIGNLSTHLQIFAAHRSKIRGIIPEEIGNLSKLSWLSLQENELTGFIPRSFEGLQSLERLYLNNNSIVGSFPSVICNLPKLGSVVLSENRISGPIPICIGNMTSLRDLNLASNNLNSSLPSSFWLLKDLLRFSASSNLLSGHLPRGIENLRAVILIDLSMNNLSGNISSSLDSLQKLIELSFAHNELEGKIPDSLGKVLSLEVLDLSYNKLTGVIPKSLEALLYLKKFNVSFNQLSGEIPTEGPFLNFTNQSFMSNGELCGASRFQVLRCNSFPPQKSKRKRLLLILSLVLGISTLILFSVLGFVFIRWQKRKRAAAEDDPSPALTHERISYHELERMTNGFSETNLVGMGSYSSVYKGLIGNGTLVAVKVFNLEFAGALKSFGTECEVLRNLRHRNLVKVITSCSNLDFKALVLEYMPNGSLERWLYSHNYFFDILKRLDIMIDVACAVDYLHNALSMPVVHCDLKPSNVLLDIDMVGHVCDFGIAKLLRLEDGIAQTKTLATIGYIAPEYGQDGLVSTKCDVYSFGIMLMETFTRMKPSDDMFAGEVSLCSWIKVSVPREITRVVDSNLVKPEEEFFDAKAQCLLSLMELALECTADSPDARINIQDVLSRLQKIRLHFANSYNGSKV